MILRQTLLDKIKEEMNKWPAGSPQQESLFHLQMWATALPFTQGVPEPDEGVKGEG